MLCVGRCIFTTPNYVLIYIYQNSHCEPIEQNDGYQISYHKYLNQQNTLSQKKRTAHTPGDRLVNTNTPGKLVGICVVPKQVSIRPWRGILSLLIIRDSIATQTPCLVEISSHSPAGRALLNWIHTWSGSCGRRSSRRAGFPSGAPVLLLAHSICAVYMFFL